MALALTATGALVMFVGIAALSLSVAVVVLVGAALVAVGLLSNFEDATP